MSFSRRAILLATIVILGGITILFIAAPDARQRLTAEDGIVEWISAAVFLGAGIVGVAAVRRWRPLPAWTWLLPAAGFIGFGEEIAYGARLVHFPLPRIDGEEIDGLHDVFDLAERTITALGFERLQVAAAGAVVVVAVLLVAHRTGRLQHLRSFFEARPALGWVTAAVTCSVIAAVFDLVGRSTPARLVEEQLEIVSAVILLIGALQIPAWAPAREPIGVERAAP